MFLQSAKTTSTAVLSHDYSDLTVFWSVLVYVWQRFHELVSVCESWSVSHGTLLTITTKIRLSCKTSLLPPSLHVVPSYSPCLVLLNIKLTEQLISCAGMIDTSYLCEACLSSAGALPSLFLRADGTHDGFRHPSAIVKALSKADLSHAIMAENKGEEVCAREGNRGSKASRELWLV